MAWRLLQFPLNDPHATSSAHGLRLPPATKLELMTALRDFIDEIGNTLDARRDKPLAPHHWLGFVKLLDVVDQDDGMSKLRQQMENVVAQRDVRFQDRCLALIPLLSAEPAVAATFNRRRRAAITAIAAL